VAIGSREQTATIAEIARHSANVRSRSPSCRRARKRIGIDRDRRLVRSRRARSRFDPPIPLSYGTGRGFCSGDGSGTACPCANNGLAGNGCASSVNANGANIASSGVPSIANDTLVLAGTGMPDSSALYFQGTTQVGGGAGAVFGDGLRCAGGSVIRLHTKTNVAGASQYLRSGRGDVARLPHRVWYRYAAAFCTVSTFNLSNGLLVNWSL
jgi:hypothetical protein